MELPVEKTISNLIAQQFPSFYNDEGPTFMAFVNAYYAWLEETSDPTGITRKAGNPLYYNRRLLDNFDIDNALEEFLEHFQKKYLYGIPFDIIINPRYLIKHVLDAYRSKGSIQCFKLLFRLIYNKDVEVYLPGVDLIKPSDGTWIQPRYLEVTDSTYNSSMVGKTIVGVSSSTTAVVEAVIRMPINNNIITMLFISNVLPRGGDFSVNEIVVQEDLIGTMSFAALTAASPIVVGSMSHIDILNGGANFSIGDQLAIRHYGNNNTIISNGIDGKVKVTNTTTSNGQLNFTITNYGYGITSSANIFIYANSSDANASGASFQILPIASPNTWTYNTDIVGNYINTAINATAYSLPANTSANLGSTISNALSYSNAIFGSLAGLTNIKTGQGYTRNASVFIRDHIPSKNLYGTIAYDTTSANVVGTGTNFTLFFNANDTIIIQANGSLSNTIEYHIVKTVANDTVITMYDKPLANSTASANYKMGSVIFPANFTLQDAAMQTLDGTINGLNSLVLGSPSFGNGVIANVTATDSGKGYVEGELVYLYPSDSLNTPTIVAGGNNYVNGDTVSAIGGNPYKMAYGTVVTNGSGTITSITWHGGSGYQTVPRLTVESNRGTNASLTTSIIPFDTTVEVQGLVRKGGIGVQRGYWSTTRSFISNDKVIQDSYFWQDFSYQLKAQVTLDKYRDILYNTFHPAGSEMFGQYSATAQVESNTSVGFSNSTPAYS